MTMRSPYLRRNRAFVRHGGIDCSYCASWGWLVLGCGCGWGVHSCGSSRQRAAGADARGGSVSGCVRRIRPRAHNDLIAVGDLVRHPSAADSFHPFPAAVNETALVKMLAWSRARPPDQMRRRGHVETRARRKRRRRGQQRMAESRHRHTLRMYSAVSSLIPAKGPV